METINLISDAKQRQKEEDCLTTTGDHQQTTARCSQPVHVERHSVLPLTLVHFSTMPSTNLWCLENLGLLVDQYCLTQESGVRVTTSLQPEGVGQVNESTVRNAGNAYRGWQMRKGDIAASFTFLIPCSKISQLVFCPLVMGLAVVRTLNNFNIPARLKWPNDIIVNDQKLAGILCQSAPLKGFHDQLGLVIGIGMNVVDTQELNAALEDSSGKTKQISATSVAECLRWVATTFHDVKKLTATQDLLLSSSKGSACLTSNLLQSLTDNVFEAYTEWKFRKFESLVAEINAVLYRRGEKVQILNPSTSLNGQKTQDNQPIEGILKGVSAHTGALQVTPEYSAGRCIEIFHGRLS